MLVPCAHLRAFEPLDAFPPDERRRWRSYVDAGAGVTRSEARSTERRVAATRLLTGRGPLSDDAALVRRVGDRIHVCPLQLDLRAASALRELRRAVPDEVVEACVPDHDALDTLDLLAATGRMPHILDEPWAVPLTWFVLFDPDERHLVAHPEGRGARITYLTSAAQALGRLARAGEIVASTIVDGDDVLSALEDLESWVGAFDPDTIVELDYGSVAGLLDAGDLDEDQSCHEVWSALEGLVDGDVLAASAYYGAVRGRWRDLRAKQRAS